MPAIHPRFGTLQFTTGPQQPSLTMLAALICDNPSMEVLVEQTCSEALVRLSGKLVAGDTDSVYQEVRKLIPVSKKIVLDLTGLAYMDSMGLGTIIRLYVSAKSAGCDLELINLSKRIRELLGLTNLLSVFSMCGEHHIKM
jgi:anti-anti-sigma factor